MCCWHDSLAVRALPSLNGLCLSTLLNHMQQAIPGAECMQAIFAQACLLQTTSVDDILLNFPEHGVHLIFESSSQKLRLIEVYDLSRLQVKLLSHSFDSSLT